MTSIDEALQKAFARRSQAAPRKSVAGGPHLRLNPAPGVTEIQRGELYVRPPVRESGHPTVQSLNGKSEPERLVAPTRQEHGHASLNVSPSVLSDVTSHELTSGERPAADRMMTSSPALGVANLRYEVLTSDPSLDGWALPVVDELVQTPTTESTTSVLSQPAGRIPQVDGDDRDAVNPPLPDLVDSGTTHAATGRGAGFKAAWEVDNFDFPEVCREAQYLLQDRIHLAVTELLDECIPTRPVISIGSWARGEGRTTVAILLAKALAKCGLRVVLVDADFDNPTVAKTLGVALEGGWNPSPSQQVELPEACVYSVEDRLTLLPLNCPGQIDDYAAQDALNELVNRLAKQFQIVVVDQGPGIAALSRLSAERLGVHLIVRDLRTTTDESLDRMSERLERQFQVPIRVIENFADCET